MSPRTISAALLTVAAAYGLAAPLLAAPPALVLRDAGLPEQDSALTRALLGMAKRAGYASSERDVRGLLAPGALTPSRCALLILPRARALPADLAPVVKTYLEAGGHVMALGVPAWDTPLVPSVSGRWVATDAFAAAQAGKLPARLLLDPADRAALTSMRRSTNAMESPGSMDAAQVAIAGRATPAFHVKVANLSGWDTYLSPDLPGSPLRPGESNTVLTARGGPRTRALAVEWNEKDGTRWIATVPLTDGWRRYSLPPSAFKPWGMPAERGARGFNPQNASRLGFGLAFTHTGGTGGAHEYWVANVGAAPGSSADEALERAAAQVQPIETLTPRYKFFPVLTTARLAPPAGQVLFTRSGGTMAAGTVRSSSPRASAAGFDKGRAWRWAELLTASDARSGAWRGAPATLFLRTNGMAIVACGVNRAAFYRQPAVLGSLELAARRIREGLFFLDAGASEYTCRPGDTVRLGARVLTVASAGAGEVTLRVAAGGATVWSRRWSVKAAPGAPGVCQAEWRVPAARPGVGYTVTVELRRAGAVVDRVSHALNLYTPPADARWVTIRDDGHFYLDGRRWRICGVNYMPSAGVAQEDGKLYEEWLSRAAYDPVVVERDLANIRKLGMNAVSVFIYRSSADSDNLLDFLRLCRKYGLKVNLSLRPGVRDMLLANGAGAASQATENFLGLIRRYDTARDDTVFAYEVAWEPNFGDQNGRRLMDPAWRDWVARRYGSTEAAEAAWGVAGPRDAAGALTNPGPDQLAGADRGAARLVADYRAFLDDWLAATYGAPARAIKAEAPRQYVSFRMASAGNPGDDQRSDLPYQFEGLARAVDFLSPECYGRVGSPEGDLGIRFELDYARGIAPHMPVIWAEVGASAWDTAAQEDGPAGLAFQGEYLRTFFRLAREADADGVFVWWYAGGFRVGENSDYGIVNPDGTARASTLACREGGRLAREAAVNLPAPGAELLYRRDAHPDGVHGIFAELKEAYAALLAAGKHPAVRSDRAR